MAIRRPTFVWALLGLLFMATGSARADETPHIVGLNLHRHAKFDRLIVELDRPLKAFRCSGGPHGGAQVQIDARARRFKETLLPYMPEVNRIQIEQIAQRTRISFAVGVKPVQIQSFQTPPRLVIDVTSDDYDEALRAAQRRVIPLPAVAGDR